MKNLLSTIALCAFMTPAVATAEVTASEMCPTLGGLAEAIMQARQNGVPMSKSYELAAGHELAMAMVGDAYNTTRWHSEHAQVREIEDFRNSVEMACYNAFGASV
jgi:hypothetical protein